MSQRPILIVEDDIDDQEILSEVFRNLHISNEVKFFERCPDLLHYLRITNDKPLIIITDVNLPIMNGLELRKEIFNDNHLRRKSIPFVFLTTSNDKQTIEKAYELEVQGYFVKENNFSAIEKTIKQIIDYWNTCQHPNNL